MLTSRMLAGHIETIGAGHAGLGDCETVEVGKHDDVSSPPKRPVFYVHFLHEQNKEAWSQAAEILGPLEMGDQILQSADMLAKLIYSVRQITHSCSGSFAALRKAVDELGNFQPKGSEIFLAETVSKLAGLALRLPQLFQEGLKMLVSREPGIIFLRREQCAALLAASFFSLLPSHKVQTCGKLVLPEFCLSHILGSEKQKVLCILNYFMRITSADAAFLDEIVSFSRRVEDCGLHESFWTTLDKPLCKFIIEHGVIEDSAGNLQADFANKYLGGGALRSGKVQEEIRFAISPECFVGMLFCEVMRPNEVIFIVGTFQYSNYTGYGRGFRFSGSCLRGREESLDHQGRRGPHIVAFDALCGVGEQQYDSPKILRELQKAYIACLGDVEENPSTRCQGFATGNWGCGAFGGDPQLKALLQWLAASAADRDLVYYPFGDHRVDKLDKVVQKIKDSGARCQDVYRMLQGHSENRVFRNILAQLNDVHGCSKN